MDNIHFGNENMLAIGICSALMVIMPVTVFVIWKVKTHSKIKPVFVGAVTFLLFAIVLKLPFAYLLYQSGSPVSEAINSNPWLYYLFGGLLAGLFEESGRFIAFKTVMKNNKQKTDAVTYGIGHGGIESIYIGLSLLSFIAIGVMINSGNTSQLTEGAAPEQIEALKDQLAQYASFDITGVFTGVLERASAMLIHISLSMLVFEAANSRKRLWLYPCAVLTHFVFDFIIVFTKFGLPLIALEIIFVVFSVTTFIIAKKAVNRL